MVDYLGKGGGDYGVNNSSPKNEEQQIDTKDGGEAQATSAYEYKMPGQESATQAVSKQSSAPGAPKAGAGASPDNLWNSILQDVVKQREAQSDSYLLLLGSSGVGKRSIVREINNKYVNCRNKSMGVEKMGSDYAALDFSFLYVKDLLDTEMA